MPGYASRVPVGNAVAAPLWAAMRGADRPLSIAELHVVARATPGSIYTRLERWRRAGFVRRHEGRPVRFAMTDTASAAAKPPTVNRAGVPGSAAPSQRERLWRAIRILRNFDLPRLMMSSEATRRSAEDFVNVLCRAGYLRIATRGNSMRGIWSIYQLARPAGPLCPSVRQRPGPHGLVRELFDPNDGSSHDVSPGRVSLCAVRRGEG